AQDRGPVASESLPPNHQGIVEVPNPGPTTPGLSAVEEQSKQAHSAVISRPAHGSPQHADERGDIYSLGCTLYVLLTGRPPFQGSTGLEISPQPTPRPLEPPDATVKPVPKELSAIIQRMVAKKPEDRFADIGEVVKVLEDWLSAKDEGKMPDLSEAQVGR